MDTEALTAVKQGNLPKLKKLISRGLNVNTQDTKYRTLLHHAVSNNEHDVAEYLLQNGANVLITTEKNNTALHLAVTRSDAIMTKIILENTTRDKIRKLVDMKTKVNGMTALYFAAKDDSYMDAFQLLECGANFEIVNNAGEQPIDIVKGDEVPQLLRLIHSSFAKAKKGDEQLVKDLEPCNPLDLTAVLNCRNNEGYTLIQILALNNHDELANQILWYRVNQKFQRETDSIRTSDRKSEIDELAKVAREFVEFWKKQIKTLENYANIGRQITANAFGKMVSRALEMAYEVLRGYREFEGKGKSLTCNTALKTLEDVLEVLGFDMVRLQDVGGGDGWCFDKLPYNLKRDLASLTTLIETVISASIEYFLHFVNVIRIFHAAKDDDVTKMEQLLTTGICSHPVDHTFRTPLGYAAEMGSKKMVKLLLKFKAKVFQDNAKSPVHLAVCKRHAKILKLLLESADAKELSEIIDRREEYNRTALHAAATKGRLDIVKTLLRYGSMYETFDAYNRTPLDLTKNEEVRNFLKLVDECFREAEEAKVELVYKLKAMETDEFMAVAGARNQEGHTLAVVAGKANAKSIAGIILRMVREAKQCDK